MALSYINNKEIKFGSAKPLNGVYTPGSPTREYEPLDSLGIYLNSGIPLSYGVENNRYMSMSDEFAATSQGNSYSFNQLFAAQMMLGFKLHDRFIACDTEHKIIGTEPLLHKAYLAEITEKTLDYFKIKIYGDKTRTYCVRMSSSEVPTSYVDLTNSFDENGLNLTQTDRQSFLSYYRFYPLTARDPSSRFEETLGVDYYLLPSVEGLEELSGDILSKFNAFISSDGTLTNLGNTAFAYAGDIDYVPNYRGETSEAAVSAAESARVILGQVEEMHADINQILPEMKENLKLTKQYRDEAMSTEIGTVREDVNQLKGDLGDVEDRIAPIDFRQKSNCKVILDVDVTGTMESLMDGMEQEPYEAIALTLEPDVPTAESHNFGVMGQICIDGNYLYVCVADNTWKKIALQEL